jgi:hypothetical protein
MPRAARTPGCPTAGAWPGPAQAGHRRRQPAPPSASLRRGPRDGRDDRGVRERPPRHIGVDNPWMQCVHADSQRAELHRQRVGQQPYPALGRAVADVASRAHEAGDARHVDDRPGAARDHDSGGGPAPAERPVEIRLDGAREVAVRHLEERRHVRRDPGVVDHHVQSAEVLGHRYRVVDIPGPAHVAGHEDGASRKVA